MATNITVMPAEEGTAKVTVGTFTDESGESVTPSAITWTLTDKQGNVINSRSAVSVSPASSVSFLLTGDDLALTGNDNRRVLTIVATYDSSLGSGLKLNHQAFFSIEQFMGIS